QIRMGETPQGMYDFRRAARIAKTEVEIQEQKLAEEVRKHTFTVISDAWLQYRKPGWAPATYDKSEFVVQKRLQPLIGHLDMRTMAVFVNNDVRFLHAA